MSIAQRARDSFGSIRNIWSHGEEEDFESGRDHDRGQDSDEEDDDSYSSRQPEPEPQRSQSSPSRGGGRGVGAVPMRMYRRDKQIYTIRPRSLEEVTTAADYLKSGSAVVINLDDVDRVTAVRIIDFMSGVCYGLDAQGHAMKLGSTIFLFTPGDFEIAASEEDYNKNDGSFFRDVPATLEGTLGAQQQASATPPASAQAPANPAAPNAAQGIERAPRSTSERPSVPAPAMSTPVWER